MLRIVEDVGETTGALQLLLLKLLDVTSIDFFDFLDARTPLLLDEDVDEDDDDEEHEDDVDLASVLLLDFLDDENEPFKLMLFVFEDPLPLLPLVKFDGVDVIVVSNSSSLTDDEHDDVESLFCLLQLFTEINSLCEL